MHRITGSRGRLTAVLGVLAVIAAVAVSPAFGRQGNVSAHNGGVPKSANLKLGKTLFIAACGGCHTLAAAGTKGKRGGNLGSEPSGYTAIVTQIKYGGDGMPAFGTAFAKSQIVAIAAYVSKSTPYSGASAD
ncbi:unannotated protein [freshwater metagenome]|uniref:Unannotated protein n=1 Tax=freshwater metagenome TaxID=449393 RepID=A0A6J6NIQ1_9ZZZZ